jgi:protein-L-isoaspartate(D-aspartate) O-methyltransferase
MLHAKPKEDTYLHKGLRRQLIQLMEQKGITDRKVLDAMNAIPRHFFIDPAFEHYAYKDRPFTISEKQTISHPFTVAFQTQLLEIKKFDKVLEVGTGSAYQACVLAEMGVQLYTIERQKELYDLAGKFFFLSRFPNIRRFFGDGFAGLPSFAPFDKIIVTCGAPFVPPRLVEQLKPGGILVVPVGDDGNHKMLRIIKNPDGTITETEMGNFKFVPMLEGKNGKAGNL